MSRTIEIVGWPGAGKSHLVRRIAEDYDVSIHAGEVEISGLAGLTGRLAACMRAPLMSVLLYALILTRRKVQFDNIRRAYAAQRRYLALYLNQRANLLVVDEGVAHAVFSSIVRTKTSRLSRFFMRSLWSHMADKGAVFYLLNTPKALCLERVRKRGGSSRFSKLNYSSLTEQTFEEDLYGEIVEQIRLSKGVTLIVSPSCPTHSVERHVASLALYGKPRIPG